jgi:transcription antitermination factor NusG
LNLWKTPCREKDSEALHPFGIASSENALSAVLQPVLAGDFGWYAVYTSSRHEKCVARHFVEREIKNFLPLYQRVHRWNKRSAVSLELPLFPNYVFVQASRQQRNAVLGVPGVLAIVGSGHTPSTLPDAEIEALRAGLERRKFEPHPYLVEGERVRIRSGAMEGMEGILIRKKKDLRVVLTLDLIQRSVAVEVDGDDVEPSSGQSYLRLPPASRNFN